MEALFVFGAIAVFGAAVVAAIWIITNNDDDGGPHGPTGYSESGDTLLSYYQLCGLD